MFDPRENQMAYTLRDPVNPPGSSHNARSEQRPRGTAQRIEVKSR